MAGRLKRRAFLHSLAVAPIAAVPGVQQPAPQQPAPPAPTGASPPTAPTPVPPAPPAAVPVLERTAIEAAAVGVPTFFTAPQFAALERLADILAPSLPNTTGALDAHVPAFLDFLIGISLAPRQALYRDGLDTLQAQARQRFSKAYEALSVEQAESLLVPLREPWTFTPPSDPFAAFLRDAKQDVRLATQNSVEASTAAAAAGRRGGGVGLYWYTVE